MWPSPAVAAPDKGKVKPVCVAERPDAASALTTAKLCKNRVEVLAERSATTQVWALPEGGFTSEVFQGPVRFKDSAGAWKPIDLTLRTAPDGSIAPVGHPAALRLAGEAKDAGEHPLASVNVGDDTLSMAWSGVLPAPALEGNTATYRGVKPGVDLVVSATRTGFDQSLVVRDRAAALSVASVTLPLRSRKLKFVSDGPGTLAIRDGKGAAVGRVPTPLVWDSQVGPAGERLREAPLAVRVAAPVKPGAKARAAAADGDVAAGSGSVDVTVSADPAWLTDPATVYPLVVDPSVDIDPASDTFVRSNSTSDYAGSNQLEIGKANGWVSQAFMKWATGRFAGAHIKSAKLHLWNWYAGSCTKAGWQAWTVAAYANPLNWGNRPAFLHHDGSSNETAGFNASCNDNWIGMNVTPFFQRAADSRANEAFMGLKAQNETQVDRSWKQVRSLQAVDNAQVPYVKVDFDAAPKVTGTQASPTSGGCVIGAGRPYSTSRTPQLRATVTDEDTMTLSTTFEWWVTGNNQIGSATVNNVPSGTVASTTIPAGALSEGGTYSWRSRATDGVRTTPWTGWCEFTVDTQQPAVPFVSSPGYPSNSTDNSWGHGAGGHAAEFRFAPAAAGMRAKVSKATGSTPCAAAESADKAIDGSVSGNSKWCSHEAAKWLQVELDGEQTLTNVVLRHAQAGGEHAAWNTRDFDIQTSLDGTNWTTSHQVRGNTAAISTHLLTAPVKARYVKIVVIKAAQDTSPAARIYEVEPYVGIPAPAARATGSTPCAAAESADKAIDGSVSGNSKWCSHEAAKWLQVELDGEQTLTNVVLRHAQAGGEHAAWNTRDFDIQTSLDATDWTTVQQVRGNTAPVSAHELATPVRARHLKIVVVTPAQDGSPAARIHELEAYKLTEVSDVTAYEYQMDDQTSATTVDATGNPTVVSLTPSQDGRRTLTVRAKDRAGNLSDPATYSFNVGRAGLKLPQAGATVIKRMKLYVEGDRAYDRVVFRYRRGPGAAEHDVPLANLHRGDGQRATEYPLAIPDLAPHAVWNAMDTLGSVGGVVQVAAILYNNSETGEPYQTQWVTVAVDANGDSAASAEVGPAAVNLLTGDASVSAADVDELGFTVGRIASSRHPDDGWTPQGERLTLNQQQVSTDTAGFDGHATATLVRVTTMGHGSTTDALEVTPVLANGDTFASLGGDAGGLRLGMRPGQRYRATGWIYVPSATGLDGPDHRALRIVGSYKDAAGNVQQVLSAKAGYTDGWQELSVDLAIPAGATEAFVRLYNGMPGGSNKKVYWDSLSVRELVAPFGPQWRGGASDGRVGSDYTGLEFPEAHLAKVNAADGGSLTFARNPQGQFFPEPGAEDLTLTKVNDSTYRLAQLDGSITEFTAAGGVFRTTSTWTENNPATSRYLYDSTDHRALLTRVVNAVEPGVGDCTTPTPARGCEVLEYEYATSTTATASTRGDVKDQVRSVKVWSWDPSADNGAGAQTAVEVARYRYDDQGGLREVWDPRLPNPLKAVYGYDAAGRVTTITPAGQLPMTLDYGKAAGDDNQGRLLRARRAALKAGTKDQLDGEVATTFVYGVPLTRASGGPHDMDHAAVSRWGQVDLPADATAVFGPEDAPGTSSATAAKPGAGGYPYATVYYLDASGRSVNTANPGGHIDTTEHDEFGNVVRSLTATHRELALGTLPDASAKATELGLPSDSTARALLLSTIHRFSADGLDRLETLGPLRSAVLQRELVDPNGARPTLAPGTAVVLRPHTVTRYDEGRPDGTVYHMATSQEQGAQVHGYPDADVEFTRTGYAAEKGGTSGWKLRTPTSSTTAAGTTYTVYDNAGRVVRGWDIGANGADARTAVSLYYTAGANSADPACGNRPEWAGRLCVRKPAGAVTGHDPARMPGVLATQRVEQYDRWGHEALVSETVGGKVRRTTSTFDAAGRPATTQVVADDTVAVPLVSTEYDPAGGQVIATRAGSASIVKEYDALGRIVKYTNADGGVTRTDYDRYGRVGKVGDDTGTSTYHYDRAVDPRGLLSSVVDSVAGTFSAKYSADGKIIEQRYPGGITRKDTLDASMNPIGRTYTRDSDNTVLYAESVTANTAGQWVRHSHSAGSGTMNYDAVGRLTKATQVAAGGCTTRVYGYDGRTNRTLKKVFRPGPDQACRDDAPDQTETHTYDSADRVTDPGYIYSAFGATTAAPGGEVLEYHANDLLASQQIGGQRMRWSLDPAMRFRTAATDTMVDGSFGSAVTKVQHYGDDSDAPRWIIEDASNNVSTRLVRGPDGALGAGARGGVVGLTLTNLHNDVVVGVDVAVTAVQVSSYDEFGVPTAGGGSNRYGWLGGAQRSSEALGGSMLMGVRMYRPALGRFLQVDPVFGGNANAYDYCAADAINCADESGKFSCRKTWRNETRRWGSMGFRCTMSHWETKVAIMFGKLVGAIGGALAGLAIGSMGGPYAAAAGAIIGAIIGWLFSEVVPHVYEYYCRRQKGILIYGAAYYYKISQRLFRLVYGGYAYPVCR